MNQQASTVKVFDGAALRSAVREYLLIQTATTYPTISAGQAETEEFNVGINDIVFNKGTIVAVHAVPFRDDLIGATVYIGVMIPRDYILPEFLPEGYSPDERIMFSIRINGETNSFRGYTTEALDAVLRVRP